MNDFDEQSLAEQFKPLLYPGDHSDIPWSLPQSMYPPFYAPYPQLGGSGGMLFWYQTLPGGVVQDGSAYYRVHPFKIHADDPTTCDYIQIDY